MNECINAIKKKIFAIEIEEENFDSVDKDIIDYESNKIMKALEQISEGGRMALNLYLFEGYDHKEISQIGRIRVGF